MMIRQWIGMGFSVGFPFCSESTFLCFFSMWIRGRSETSESSGVEHGPRQMISVESLQFEFRFVNDNYTTVCPKKQKETCFQVIINIIVNDL